MVTKKEIRALINAVKDKNEHMSRSHLLGLIAYYLGEVTQEDRDEVRNS
jgi:hypothetical protein